MSQDALFALPEAAPEAPVRKTNPCLLVYGPGPEGAICWDCEHLFRRGYHTRHYLKCDLRKETRGAGSDHRARWPACGRFLERT